MVFLPLSGGLSSLVRASLRKVEWGIVVGISVKRVEYRLWKCVEVASKLYGLVKGLSPEK